MDDTRALGGYVDLALNSWFPFCVKVLKCFFGFISLVDCVLCRCIVLLTFVFVIILIYLELEF